MTSVQTGLIMYLFHDGRVQVVQDADVEPLVSPKSGGVVVRFGVQQHAEAVVGAVRHRLDDRAAEESPGLLNFFSRSLRGRLPHLKSCGSPGCFTWGVIHTHVSLMSVLKPNS